jgi:hypothetical protein
MWDGSLLERQEGGDAEGGPEVASERDTSMPTMHQRLLLVEVF